MKLKCLGCEALARLVYYCAALSPHLVDVELLQLGLHSDPPDLRDQLQDRIDAAAGQGYDAIVLAYGLCGKATDGLLARQVPLVFPRAHDCITLFLGSRERYQDQFERIPGTYWYALDFIERRDGSGTTLSLGSGVDTDSPRIYEQYVEKYGKHNADYLMEVMGAWKQNYQRAVFVDMGIGDGTEVATRAQAEADLRGWTFERLTGDLVLIRRLLMGDWETDFLVLEPGQQLVMTHDHKVMDCLTHDRV